MNKGELYQNVVKRMKNFNIDNFLSNINFSPFPHPKI